MNTDTIYDWHEVKLLTCPAKAALIATITRMLNMALLEKCLVIFLNNCITIHHFFTYPTMVPTPTSLSTLTPATEVNNSGAEEPAAMKVAPATSSLRSSFSEMASSDGTKKSSQIMASAALRQIA